MPGKIPYYRTTSWVGLTSLTRLNIIVLFLSAPCKWYFSHYMVYVDGRGSPVVYFSSHWFLIVGYAYGPVITPCACYFRNSVSLDDIRWVWCAAFLCPFHAARRITILAGLQSEYKAAFITISSDDIDATVSAIAREISESRWLLVSDSI